MTSLHYAEFLDHKRITAPVVGFDVDRSKLHPDLFPWQADIVRWALRRGRAAILTGCGTGKTFMELEWGDKVSKHTDMPVLLLAPLAVSHQTEREARKFGIEAVVCERQDQVPSRGIAITNYQKLHHFDVSKFAGGIIDEASILKDFGGATCQEIIDTFQHTPYKIGATATPAPNDHMEIANQCDFLGIMRRSEMLSTYFVHDSGKTQDWRLKRHAEDDFWRWMCSWAVMLQKPSDLGYSDEGFDLPPLEIFTHLVSIDRPIEERDTLWILEAADLTEQRQAKRMSIPDRVAKAAQIVAAEPDEQWLIWVELNDESTAMTKAIPGAVEVTGSDSDERKVQVMLDFVDGKIRKVVTKQSMFGFGMNLQNCARHINASVTHSYEKRYQTIRRSYRYGQTRPVHIHDVLAETEVPILRNLERKEREAARLADGMRAHMADISSAVIRGADRERATYQAMTPMRLPTWLREEMTA